MVKVRCFASFVKGEEISQNDTFVCPMSTEMVGILPSLAKEVTPRSSRRLPTRSGWFVQPPRKSVRRLNKPPRPLHKGRFAPLLMSRPPPPLPRGVALTHIAKPPKDHIAECGTY